MTLHDERRRFLASMLDETTLLTRNVSLAAHLVTLGARVTQTKNAVGPTGAPRASWRIEHPSLRFMVQQYFETIRVCPAKLFKNRDLLKSGITPPP